MPGHPFHLENPLPKDIYQRWQMVSCHTARRSFATNMWLRGNDRDVICAVNCHSTEASLSNYIKEDRLTRASRLTRCFACKESRMIKSHLVIMLYVKLGVCRYRNLCNWK